VGILLGMLQHLSIKNYVLIQEATLQPARNFTAVTGETGAGKTILLGAVSLLLGERAATNVLLNKDKKCIIEGVFDIQPYPLTAFFEKEGLDYDATTTIRREINPAGKSRAFVNDTPVKLSVLKALGSRLVDIHSQYDTLLLGDATFQLAVVDAYAANEAVRTRYQEVFTAYQAAHQAHEKLVLAHAQQQQSLDYHQFLLNELREAQLEAGQQEQLEASLQQLEHAETLQVKVADALEILDGSAGSVSQGLAQATQLLDQLAGIAQNYQPLQERLASCLIEIQDITTTLASEQTAIVVDPAALEVTQDRLDTIYRLQQKHRVQTVAALIKLADDLEKKVDKVVNAHTTIDQAKATLEKEKAALLVQAKQLTTSRKGALEGLTRAITGLLQTLGMPEARIPMTLTPTVPHETGMDAVQVLFSANKGIAPQPLKQVASGGEFARLMLCFKFILAKKAAMPTLIFDEIDTGISGEIALKMAGMLQKMAANHQVIAITHLPQIAAKAAQHWSVYKDRSAAVSLSKLKQLTPQERIVALAAMIGGDTPSAVARATAEELLRL